MLLARAGLRVLAVDRGREGADTISTHALMRAGVLQLHRWGLLDEVKAAGTPVVRKATFHYGDEALPVDIKARDGVEGLYAPRRTVLDPILVAAARAAGAQVEHQTSALELVADASGRVHGAVLERSDGQIERVEAPIVIGADGLRSRVAALAGAPAERVARHASAVVYAVSFGVPRWTATTGLPSRREHRLRPDRSREDLVFVATTRRAYRAELPVGVEALYRSVLAGRRRSTRTP